jgi:hypothetical protein
MAGLRPPLQAPPDSLSHILAGKTRTRIRTPARSVEDPARPGTARQGRCALWAGVSFGRAGVRSGQVCPSGRHTWEGMPRRDSWRGHCVLLLWLAQLHPNAFRRGRPCRPVIQTRLDWS